MPCAAISEAQNEVRDFQKWDFDIIPHRMVMKTGLQTPDGKRVPVEDAYKNPRHPFRVAIICAMWLTGKPMKAHNLMHAIARAPADLHPLEGMTKAVFRPVQKKL